MELKLFVKTKTSDSIRKIPGYYGHQGECQSVRIIRVSALNELSEKHEETSRTHVLWMQTKADIITGTRRC